MKRPARMIQQAFSSILKKPATVRYPQVKPPMPDKFRGRLSFKPESCVGCKLCMKDCPAGAITINKVGEKKFEAAISLGDCIYCGQCVESCAKKALEMTKEFELAQLTPDTLKIVFHGEPEKTDTEKS